MGVIFFTSTKTLFSIESGKQKLLEILGQKKPADILNRGAQLARLLKMNSQIDKDRVEKVEIVQFQ